MRGIFILIMALIFPVFLGANDPQNGKELFRNYCKACHNIEESLVGPALKDVHIRRSEDWIYSFVKSSSSMIEQGDSTASALFMEFNQIPMPDHALNEGQISDILSYIIQESESPPQEDALISRPLIAPKPRIEPLHFGDFRFWIVYTITVIIMIGVLYYMVEITSLSKGAED